MKAGDRVHHPPVGTTRFQEVLRRQRLQGSAQACGHVPRRRPILLRRQFKRGALHGRDRRVVAGLEPSSKSRNRREGDEGFDQRQLAANLLEDLLDDEIAEADPGEPLLAIRDRIERRHASLLRRHMRAPWGEQGRNRRRRGQGQPDLDEDQRFVDKPGVKERVASTVGRIDAPPEFVPVADFVHRFVADDLLEHRRRRRPVDAAQNQKAAIEP